jgi:hypothetical protein
MSCTVILKKFGKRLLFIIFGSLLLTSAPFASVSAQDEASVTRAAEERGEKPRSLDDRLSVTLFAEQPQIVTPPVLISITPAVSGRWNQTPTSGPRITRGMAQTDCSFSKTPTATARPRKRPFSPTVSNMP